MQGTVGKRLWTLRIRDHLPPLPGWRCYRVRNPSGSCIAISASIPFWTRFTAIFPLALSMDTASGINGEQQVKYVKES
jgi:hypothetical protein